MSDYSEMTGRLLRERAEILSAMYSAVAEAHEFGYDKSLSGPVVRF